MPNPNVIVSTSIRLIPDLDKPADELLKSERGLMVELDEKRQLRLDPEDPRSAEMANILNGLSKIKQPVYLEVDPEKESISRILIPYVTRVNHIKETDGGMFEVELELSHARHYLSRESEDYRELEKKLSEAQRSKDYLIVTEEDTNEIIDVRKYPGDEKFPDFPRPEPLPKKWRWWFCWPWKYKYCWPFRWFFCVSKTKAKQVFDTLNATSCDPLTVPPPCIPFLYPDDGCWGRAHEMCRLMINMNLKPKKVWIQGSLHVVTKNKPTCHVYWGWHVAPTLCVRKGWFFATERMVMDPSLFNGPVSKSTWKGVQDDPSAILTDSAASAFYLWSNATDPTYTQTNQVLATYRLKLQTRSLNHGPPPYANCP